jgi:ATP-dependent Clp protease ATP-binding subunit ClpB
MNINKYTEKAQEAILGAQQLADHEGHPEITPEHLLLTLVDQQGGIVPEILRKMNVDPAAVSTAIRTELGRNPRAHGGSQPSLSARLRQVTNAAEAEAERLKDEFVSTEHLLLAIAGEGGRAPAARILQQVGAGHDAILQASTRRSSATGATSPTSRARASSIRSSDVTTRSGASSRSSRGAPRTIPC